MVVANSGLWCAHLRCLIECVNERLLWMLRIAAAGPWGERGGFEGEVYTLPQRVPKIHVCIWIWILSGLITWAEDKGKPRSYFRSYDNVPFFLVILTFPLQNCSEGLDESYAGDTAFANAVETFGGGHDDPISVAVGGSCWALLSLFFFCWGHCPIPYLVFQMSCMPVQLIIWLSISGFPAG